MKRLYFLIILFFADFVLCNQYVIKQKSEKLSVNIDDAYIKSFTSYVNFVPYETVKLPFPFYEEIYNYIFINANGALHLKPEPPCGNSLLEGICVYYSNPLDGYNNVISGLLTNFVSYNSSDSFIYYKISNESVEVLYDKMILSNIKREIDYSFSIKIYESGKIKVHYYKVYSIDDIKSMEKQLPNYLRDDNKYKIFVSGIMVGKSSSLSFIPNKYSNYGKQWGKNTINGYYPSYLSMFKNDTTIEYYPLPRSFCLSPFYVNYSSGCNITLSTDRIVELKMKFEYKFKYNNEWYSDRCIITSNTTLNCFIPSLSNKPNNNDTRIYLSLYYYDLTDASEAIFIQQLQFIYTCDEEKINMIDSCNLIGNKCDSCGYCNGNNWCYNFNNSCDNILYNKGCDELCEEDEIKIDKKCCNINSLDCYGKCNGTAEIVNVTTSSSSSSSSALSASNNNNNNNKYELTCCLFDCNNTCNGLAYIECDECVGGLTGKNSTMDCNGTCNGYGIENECGYCVNISGRPLDYGIDCKGGCDEDLFINNCGVCDYMNYSYCEIEFEENEYYHGIFINKNTRKIIYYFDIINNSNKSVIPFISDALSSYSSTTTTEENMKLYYKHDRYWIFVGSSLDVFYPFGIINFRLEIDMGSGFTQVINNMNNVEYFNITFKSDIYEVYESQIHSFYYINNSSCSEITNYVLCNNIPGCYCCYYSDGYNSQIVEKNQKYVFNCVNYSGNGNPCFVPNNSASFSLKYFVCLIFVIFYSIFIL